MTLSARPGNHRQCSLVWITDLLTPAEHTGIIGYVPHHDPETALEELNDDAVLPHPVHVRDMIVRAELTPEQALELNRVFQRYLEEFGELQKLVRPVLEELARGRQPRG